MNDTNDKNANKDNSKQDTKSELHRIKIETYFKEKIPVHITLITREWLNGEILKIAKNFFLIKERKKGEMPVFFAEIYDIDKLDLRDGSSGNAEGRNAEGNVGGSI